MFESIHPFLPLIAEPWVHNNHYPVMSEPYHRLHDLPGIFHSEETDNPFSHCQDCGHPLATCEEGHLIQKVFSGGETILEIAICSSCHETLMHSYSLESRERIWNFYLDHGNLGERLRKFFPIPVGNPEPWINHCITCQTPRTSTREYVIACQVIADQLVYGETPLMICLGCMDKIVELLSEQSRETYDRWLDRVAPGTPESVSPKPRPRIFV
jgi:hypothetical protein